VETAPAPRFHSRVPGEAPELPAHRGGIARAFRDENRAREHPFLRQGTIPARQHYHVANTHAIGGGNAPRGLPPRQVRPDGRHSRPLEILRSNQTSREGRIMTKPTKLIVFSCGGKGGVGKTTVATAIADFYSTRAIPATLFDCDTENKQRGSLSHFF